MNLLMYGVIFIGLVSCSSSPFKETTREQEMVNEHLSQGVKFLEGDFDSKYSQTGKRGAVIVSGGSAIYPIETNQKLVENAAVADAKFRLTESAPSEFRKEVRRAIGTELDGVGEFSQTDVSITEVQNLTGVRVKYEDIQCRTRVEPTSTGEYRTMRECRALATVKVSQLKNAYDFTVAKKYGVTKTQIIDAIGK